MSESGAILAQLQCLPSWEVDPFLLQLPKAVLGDKAFMLEAIKLSGIALRLADPRLRADREVVAAAVAQDGHAFKYAALELKSDLAILEIALAKSWTLQALLPKSARKSAAVQLLVARSGCPIHLLPWEARSNREVILEAVSFDGLALEHAKSDLQEDEGIVRAAVRQNPLALSFVSPSLRGDADVVSACHELKSHWLAEVARDAQALRATSAKDPPLCMREDRDVVAAALRQDGMALQWCPASVLENKELVVLACENSGGSREARDKLAHILASAEMLGDADVAAALFGADECARVKAERLRDVRIDGISLRNAELYVRHDREIVLAALASDAQALEFASAALKGDREVVLEALQWQSEQELARQDELARKDNEVLSCTFGEDWAVMRNDADALEAKCDEEWNGERIVDGVALSKEECENRVRQALDRSDYRDFAEVRAMCRPPNGCEQVMVAALMILHKTPIQQWTTWRDACQGMGNTREFLDGLRALDAANATEAIEAVRSIYMHEEFFDFDVMRRKSMAMAALVQWMQALDTLHSATPQYALMKRAAHQAQGLPNLPTQRSVVRHSTLLDDREVFRAALSQDGRALEFASDELRGDRELALVALRTGGKQVLGMLKEPLSADDPELVAAAQPRHVVLTLHVAPCEEGPGLNVACTSMSGAEVAKVRVQAPEEESLSSLRTQIAAELDVFPLQLRLLLPSGKILADETSAVGPQFRAE